MTPHEARAWLSQRYSDADLAKLERFVELLAAEAERQSLIAPSTLGDLWARHIVDSAQLLQFAPEYGHWLDIGSGGGLPGLVLSILNPAPITLCEPRKLRATALGRMATALALSNVTVLGCKVQAVKGRYRFITARAVAPIDHLFAWTEQLVSRETTYILPRGRSAAEELENARATWQGTFHVKQSLTSVESGIIIATGVSRR